MGRIVISTIFLSLALIFCGGKPEAENIAELPAYKNPSLPVEQRVSDLISRMTLEEKVAQTYCLSRGFDKIFDEKGKIKPDEASKLLKLSVGHIAKPFDSFDPKIGAERNNAVQKLVMENTRLGIPVIIHGEGLHGFMAKGATSFPQAIALASTWDPKLNELIFTAVSKEMRARGTTQVLSPLMDIARDPRWGRTEETYGEDPYLVSQMGMACVRGLQGKVPVISKDHVVSTVKHFAVYSQPERGINYSPGNYSERIIRENFLATFQAAITEAGAMSVMPSYNEIDGIPSHANKWLLTKVLRGEWGFQGLVVSDYNAINELETRHHIAKDKAEAAKKALEAGVDIELYYIDCYATLEDQIINGTVKESDLDKAVSRILRTKFLLGLFENPYADTESTDKVTNCKEHRDLALKAAHEAVVLLKNDKSILPINPKKIKSIAVIGPNAADIHLGGYSYEPREGIDILKGIKDKAGDDFKVLYAKGCGLTKRDLFNEDKVEAADPVENAKLIKEAVKTAKKAEVVLLVVGENEVLCREAWSTTHLGDRNSLDLYGQQNDLVKAIYETGVPVIVFLMNGRPLSINYINEHIPAIIEGWYLGQETGTAVADVIFGDYNPGGKLPITFPRSAGDIPAYYNHKPSIDQNYVLASSAPLFPFGYGLSYTSFEYSEPKVYPDKIGPSGKTSVTVDVKNTGKYKGDEVVQMYIRDDVSSVTRPVKELKGFERITLDPGETKTVTFEINPSKLSFLNENMERVVEPGDFTVMVGTNSEMFKTVKFEVVNK